EYDNVSTNITMIMSGIDLRTKQFTEPPEQIKKDIAALKADKSVSEAEKKDDLAQLKEALKTAKPIQFKENIALVLKYFDKLSPLMQEWLCIARVCGSVGRRDSSTSADAPR